MTLNELKLNVCSIGDPTDPRCWSGAPSHICAELRKRHQLGEAFDADVPRILKILSLLTIPLYGESDLGRTPLRRYACAFNSAKRTERSTSVHTLHTGTLSLPFLIQPQEQHHYLFCDSTWNLWSSYSTNMETYSKRMITTFDNLEKRAYSQVDHIFSVSHYVKENLMEHYGLPPGKVTVVGTGLGAIGPFYGRKDYSNRKILFVAKGRFRDKGGELVIEAFRRALEFEPQLQLTVVGTEEAREFHKNPNVTVFGFVPLQELQELFNTHSLFLMPALNEPWGLVYLEAMACRMPIMGLKRNSFPELSGYGKHGFSIEEANPTVLADALVNAFRNPELLEEMGEQAQAYCLSQFSWEKTVNQIVEVIENKERHA